ncbi:hypothetical protein HK096_000087 [Nowakowskiella sp. JEL0078]|nr:hypothetical protein HK096_000087 [Nowakowskiella sp. JEL0078]
MFYPKATNITGTGSSFIAPLYTAWASAFKKANGLQLFHLFASQANLIIFLPASDKYVQGLDYISKGSSAGLADSLSFSNMFGAADFVPAQAQIINGKLANNVSMQAVPTIGGFVYILILVADIFANKIKIWGDSQLVQNNPQLSTFTNVTIQFVVRNVGSGTTQNFMAALKQFDSTFPGTVSSLPDWNWIDGGLKGTRVWGGATNSDMAVIVGSIQGTISYMDIQDAYRVQYALIQNRAGNYINATNPAAITSAMTQANGKNIEDISASVLDTTVADAYPITVVVFSLLRLNSIDSDIDITRWTLRFLWWCLSNGTTTATPGNNTAAAIANQLYYIPLESGMRTQALNILKLANYNGKSLYGNSPCDFDAGSENGCKNGATCAIPGPFQDVQAQCLCKGSFANINKSDCSENAELFTVKTNDLFSILSLILVLFSMLVIIIIFAFVFIKRNHPHIRAIAPDCSYFILAGCFLGTVGAFVYTVIPSKTMCYLRPFFPAMAFGAVFGMVFMKSYRIFMIFGYSRMKVSSQGVRNTRLILFACAVAFLEAIFVGLFLAFTQPVSSTQYSSSSSTYMQMCISSTDGNAALRIAAIVSEFAIYVFNAFLLGGCLYLAFKTRTAYERFVESRSIGFAIYLVSITLTIGLAVLFGMPNDPSTQKITALIRTILILVSSVGVACILFLPRLVEVFQEKKNDVSPIGINGKSNNVEEDVQVLTMEMDYLTSSGENSTFLQSSKSLESHTVQALSFKIGMRVLRFGSVWTSQTLMLLPELDMIAVFDSVKDGRIAASFKVSLSSHEPSKDDGMVFGAHSNSKSVRINLRTVKNEVYIIEFATEERCKTFSSLFDTIKSRAQQKGSTAGNQSLHLVTTPRPNYLNNPTSPTSPIAAITSPSGRMHDQLNLKNTPSTLYLPPSEFSPSIRPVQSVKSSRNPSFPNTYEINSNQLFGGYSEFQNVSNRTSEGQSGTYNINNNIGQATRPEW